MRVKASVVVGWCVLHAIAAASASAAGADSRLIDAVKRGRTEFVKTLIQQKVDVNAPQPDGATALHWAAQRDDMDSAVLLVGAGANANVSNDTRRDPIVD